MSSRKKRYVPKSFESTGASGDVSANLYRSMLESEAFKALTKREKLLYVYCKLQYYGAREPGRDFPNMEQLQGSDMFYFNFALASKKYGLYAAGSRREFYNDMKSLCEHGFIELVVSGKPTKSRSIYRFSGKWKFQNARG